MVSSFSARMIGFVPVPLPGSKSGDQIRFIVPDEGNVWIGAVNGGLYRWRSGRGGPVAARRRSPGR